MATPKTKPAIETKDLVAGYPGQPPIIQDINFELQSGEILGIAGPNGAGKSTLLKTLCGLLQSGSGQVLIHGQPIEEFTTRELAAQVSTVLQSSSEGLPFTVIEYVAQGRYPHIGALGKMGPSDYAAVEEAMEECALAELAGRNVSELSAGETQRATLAQALAQKSPILLLDEPNVHLDLQHQEHLANVLRQKAKQEGKALIIVLHDLQMAKELCDRVLLLHEGKVLSVGTPEDVLRQENLAQAYPSIEKSKDKTPRPKLSQSRILTFLPLLLLLIASYVSIQTGEMGMPPWSDIFGLFSAKFSGVEGSSLSPLQIIFWELRLPRTLLGILVGANIAVAGALMQGYFRNPLAEPYVAGVSAGAACGAVVVLTTSLPALLLLPPNIALPIFAFLGAVLSTWIVYKLSTRHGQTSTTMLLLGGIAIGGILQAITIGLLLQSEPHNMQNVLSWLMGSLAYRGWEHIPAVAIGGIAGLTISILLSRPLDLLATEGENAITLGLPVQRIRRIILATSCFLAATSVASCGIIAFVGLMAPHIIRMIYGAKHSRLLPQTAILGALLLTTADILARNLLPAQELPIGIITGVVGAIFLLFLISRRNVG